MADRPADRVRLAEERLAWQPLPDPPRRYRRRLARVSADLAAYVLDEEPAARQRLAAALDRVISDARFHDAPEAFRAELLIRAGVAHNWVGVAERDPGELTRARRLLESCAALVPHGTPLWARLELNLSNTLLNLHQHDIRGGLLDDAEAHARSSLRFVGDDRLLRSRSLSGVADTLRTRFRERGDPAVLTEAISYAEEALATARDTYFGTRFAYVVADLLSVRYDTYGSLDDLNRAIAILRDPFLRRDTVMAPGSSEPFGGTLGAFLRRRYARTHERADIDEAIRLMSVGVDDRAVRDPARLTNLGNAHLDRFDDYGDVEDLRRAVDLQVQALELTAPGDWQLASRHNNAGNAFSVAWRVSRDASFAYGAIDHYRAALDLTAETAPERASREYNLANTLRERPDDGEDPTAEAIAAYRAAVRHGSDHALEWALAAARRWGDWARERGAWEEAAEAYDDALEVSHRLFQVQLLREDKETWLVHWQGLPADAAYAMFRAGRPREAVEALEAGRGLLLSETLEQNRADLERVAEQDSELVGRYRAASEALESAMHSGAPLEDVRARRTELDREIARIRSVPGYGDFLLRPTFDDVRNAVPSGAALVYLAAAGHGGVALAVGSDGRVRGVELPAATASAVRRRAETLVAVRGAGRGEGAWEGTLDAVTRWAWTAVAAPVLALTAETELVLVPSGMLAMLPLHASWTAVATGRRYLLDERTVRYVPNGRALRHAARGAMEVAAERILVVADPRPTALRPIGHARAETAWARRWFADGAVLAGSSADRRTVTESMQRASVHHFICHGAAHPDRPLDSALVLGGDEPLRLRDVLALRLRQADGRPGTRLAVLSACDTDRPGTELPDEVVSLPTGLIQAGAAGVVATQWSVRSEAVALPMARFYQLWRGEGRSSAAALCGAQRWLRDTTNGVKVRDLTEAGAEGDARELIWTLLLREPDERSFDHPVHWAALSFNGA